jgi:uncharacterized membrane protein YhiD involved in acid resistance
MPLWLSQLLGIASTSGVTVGGILGLSFVLLNRGIIWVKPAVDRLNKEHDDTVARINKEKDDALASQKAQYDSRISEIILGKDEVNTMLKTQLTQAFTDRDAYRQALSLERSASDALTTKVVNELVPYVQLTTKHMGAIEEIAKEVGPSEPN